MISTDEQHKRVPLELWGGAECTVNRVGDQYLEQLGRTGHLYRLSDFERFAALGVKALRQSVLWETTAPDGKEAARWEWADAALEKLGQLRIRPIVGLLHHGSGPAATDLLDCAFPDKLAAYAEMVARRYPWVEDYTPVNEPLTTARFSALYGHWYPHHRDELSFARALLNECRGVVLSMEAIRRVNPSARLVQTEDMAKIFSTPRLAYQAEFENERRWCSYDLLCGRVDRSHRMWGHFRWAGIEETELAWFLDHPCPPDIIGINHYLSGNRYLDEDLNRYPFESHGGNGRDRYADVLAARVLEDGAVNVCELLIEAWERYGLPIAITECHNSCTREEQLRWFHEVWKSAEEARRNGADIRAVTAWSLLGAFDWNHLVTEKNDHYEPGVYDVRSTPPRATALVELISDLGAGREPRHPALEVPGWWHRSQRFVYGFTRDATGQVKSPRPEELPPVRPVLITGAGGMLGKAFAIFCERRGLAYQALTRDECDITDPLSVRRALFETQPWAVINAAGYTRVDDAELNPEDCYRSNTEGALLLARECEQRGLRLLTFSPDLVFEGTNDQPYVESDDPAPLNRYGCSKAKAERQIVAISPSALIVRSGPLFSAWDDRNFLMRALRALRDKCVFRAADDLVVSPTYVPDLVQVSLDLLTDFESGLWHLANEGQITWLELAEQLARTADVPARSLRRCVMEDFQLPARRPRFSALSSERGILLPKLEDALQRFVLEANDLWIPIEEPLQKLAA